MIPFNCLGFCTAILALMIFGKAECLAAETLQELLDREDIPADVILPGDFSKLIDKGRGIDTKDYLILPVYVIQSSGHLSRYFYVFRQDKQSRQWTTAKLEWPITESVLTSSSSDSLIFSTIFSDQTDEHPEVVCVFRNISNVDKMQYSEFLASDLIKRYGDRPLSYYLQPEILTDLFIRPSLYEKE